MAAGGQPCSFSVAHPSKSPSRQVCDRGWRRVSRPDGASFSPGFEKPAGAWHKEVAVLPAAGPKLWLAFLGLGCHGSQGPSSQTLREAGAGQGPPDLSAITRGSLEPRGARPIPTSTSKPFKQKSELASEGVSEGGRSAERGCWRGTPSAWGAVGRLGFMALGSAWWFGAGVKVPGWSHSGLSSSTSSSTSWLGVFDE